MIIAVLIYLFMGFVQLAAMMKGFSVVFGKVLGFIISLFLSQIPIVGPVFGIVGAMKGWGWSFLKSILVFVIPYILACLIGFVAKKKD